MKREGNKTQRKQKRRKKSKKDGDRASEERKYLQPELNNPRDDR